MLDKISLEIINALCRNGSLSNAKIAQSLGFSEITVSKKLKAMVDDGVIAIKAIPNTVKMGYRAAAFIGLNVDLKEIDNICAQLVDNIHINLVVTCFGRFDMLLIVYFCEWQMLFEFVRETLPGMKGIHHIETSLISGTRKRNQNIFPNNLVENKPIEISDIDQSLIKELIRDGRPNYSDLAKKLGLSLSTVSKHISSLVKAEIIEIVAMPNASKLGFSTTAFVALNIDLTKIDRICDQIAHFPEVNLVIRLMNSFDILFAMNATDPEALLTFLKNNIATIDGILSTETFIRGDFFYFSADAMFTPSTK